MKGDSARPLMADSSPDRIRVTQPSVSDQSTTAFQNYPYGSQRIQRTASPDALSDDERLQPATTQTLGRPYHQPFSYSSQNPSPGTATPPRPSSRRRPSPPAVYTPPPAVADFRSRDFAGSSERVPQIPMLEPPQQPGTRRITIGATENTPAAARSVPSLEPPVQLAPSYRRTNSDMVSPTLSGQALAEVTHDGDETSRGRRGAPEPQQVSAHNQVSESLNQRDQSNNGSKDRFAEQSARERAERRERAQRRQSQGPPSRGQSMDIPRI